MRPGMPATSSGGRRHAPWTNRRSVDVDLAISVRLAEHRHFPLVQVDIEVEGGLRALEQPEVVANPVLVPVRRRADRHAGRAREAAAYWQAVAHLGVHAVAPSYVHLDIRRTSS